MLSVWRTEDASIWGEQPDTQLYAEVQMLSNKDKNTDGSWPLTTLGFGLFAFLLKGRWKGRQSL